MAHVIKPPQPIDLGGKTSVFLAGTIDNGHSIDWQSNVEESLSATDLVLLNPRRDNWDPAWDQSIENPLFREQVEWELTGLEIADAIFMYFAAGSKSPITLLELGLHADSRKLIPVCPPGFWRRGNLEVVCAKYDIPLYETIADGLLHLRRHLNY